jgi:excisionase family DNA binding protein
MTGRTVTEWLTAKEAAAYAKCGVQSIYNGVKRKRLRAARINGSGNLRFLAEWIDAWLLAEAAVVMTPGDKLSA